MSEVGTDELEQGLALETTQVAQSTLYGAVNETAPASDTASSGLNGRLQRIAQRITSLITAITDRSQKTQITNGTIDAGVLASVPTLTANGLVTRDLPYDPITFTAAAYGIAHTANKSMISLVHGSAASKIKIHAIKIINVQTGAVTGVVNEYRLQRITSHSAGTDLTTPAAAGGPMAHDTTDTLTGVALRTNATLVGLSTFYLNRWFWSTDEWGTGTVDVEAQDHTQQTLSNAFESRPGSEPIIINNGQGVTIQSITATAGTIDIIMLCTLETI